MIKHSTKLATRVLAVLLLSWFLTGCDESSRQQQVSDHSTPESGVIEANQEAPDAAGSVEAEATALADPAGAEGSVPQPDEPGPATVIAEIDPQPELAVAKPTPSMVATKPADSSPVAVARETTAAAKPMDTAPASPPILVAVAAQAPAEPIAEPVAEQKTLPVPAVVPEIPAVAVAAPATQAPVSAPPAAPLDLDSLENRLRKTKSIGLFTKLELKGQVEDLVKEVDMYHRSKSSLSLEQLEEHFDLLVMKLLILVQDGDPALSKEIATARPTLWTALADPIQFSSIKGP